MNKLYAKIAAGAASAFLLGGLLTTSVLADDVIITGNGAGSTNTVTITDVTTCNVTQSNSTSVHANVNQNANTGGNTANGNTGGAVTITTGAASATSTITVTGGNNTAVNPCCCPTPCVDSGCCEGSGQALGGVLIEGNGDNSHNTVTPTTTKTSTVGQTGSTRVRAKVKQSAKTGKNKAKNNTGPGSVDITTGDSTLSSDVSVTGGSNSL